MEWFLGLDAKIQAALIAAVVSVFTVTVGGFLKSVYESRSHSRKLRLDYKYKHKSRLRSRVGDTKGRLIVASEAFSRRMFSFYEDHATRSLEIPRGEIGPIPYYPRSFTYRILCTVALAHQFEKTSTYIDLAVADKEDLTFLKVVKLMLFVWTDPRLYEGLSYDSTSARDHIYKGVLNALCADMMTDAGVLGPAEFEDILSKPHHFSPVLKLVSNLSPSEDRLRLDRFRAAHVVHVLFLNRFGYDFNFTGKERLGQVIRGFERPKVAHNLARMIEHLQLHKEKHFRWYCRNLPELLRTSN